MEQIVSREVIRTLARKAASTDRAVQEANPYPEHTAAYRIFEEMFWDCVRERDAACV
jgi:hypothetical protein